MGKDILGLKMQGGVEMDIREEIVEKEQDMHHQDQESM